MILLTHAIVGAAAGRLVSNPLLSFALGFVSHFIIDAIPHWGYPLASVVSDEKSLIKKDMALNRKFIKDLILIGFDFSLGIILAIFIFQGRAGFINTSIPLIMGALGGVLPDALQFAYLKIRREPLITLEKIHLAVHTKEDYTTLSYGILSQIFVIIAAIIISKLIF